MNAPVKQHLTVSLRDPAASCVVRQAHHEGDLWAAHYDGDLWTAHHEGGLWTAHNEELLGRDAARGAGSTDLPHGEPVEPRTMKGMRSETMRKVLGRNIEVQERDAWMR